MKSTGNAVPISSHTKGENNVLLREPNERLKLFSWHKAQNTEDSCWVWLSLRVNHVVGAGHHFLTTEF